MSVEISIIVPCYNEGENVLELAERVGAMFDAHGITGEIIFVDDASTDNTGTLIDDLAARHAFVRAVHHPVNRGIPGGWESGCRAARGRYVAIMDGDLQNLPEDVYRLYRELKYTNADVVQAHRSHIGRVRDFRYTMSRVLHHMLRVLFRVPLTDIKSGFLVCDREVFAHILRRRFTYYYFQTFIVVSAFHKGYRIVEIESLFEERKLGKSFISAFPLKMILKNLVDLMTGVVEFRVLPARTDILSDFLGKHPVSRDSAPLPLLRRLGLRGFALLMPLHHWKLTSAALRYYYQLRRTQWLAPEELRELQEVRLRTLIKHAYRHVPYYRECFDRLGIDPNAIQRLEDLQRIPVLTKDDIRRHLHFDLMSDTHDKLRMLPVTTTGASGEPLMLYVDRTQLEMRWATSLRDGEWLGYRFGDRLVRLWDMVSASSQLARFNEWLDALLTRRTVLRASILDEATTRRAFDAIRLKRPALVEAETEVLALLARRLRRPPSDGGRPRALVSSAQTLSAEGRAAIEQAFGIPVFDRYASREFGGIAQECEAHSGHHVNGESYVVEIVRDGRPTRPGETGDVLVTDLANFSAPLIRYAIGDRATATDARCPCGRGLPLIGSIEGRQPAVVVGANGAPLPGGFFSASLRDLEHLIRRFQVVQRRPGAVDFFVVKGPRFSTPAFDRLLAQLRQRLGDATEIAVHFVERIDAVRTPVEGLSPLAFDDGEQAAAPSPPEIRGNGAAGAEGPWEVLLDGR